MKKSKELKEELKYDIHSANVEIDKIVEKIGKEYILESLFRHQNNNAKYLEAQLESLKLQEKSQMAEFEGKAFVEQKPKTQLENVQKILDMRVDQLSKEKDELEQQMKEYEEMKSVDSAQLKLIAHEYEKFMFFKCSLEKEM